jgi:hypothetical protein
VVKTNDRRRIVDVGGELENGVVDALLVVHSGISERRARCIFARARE